MCKEDIKIDMSKEEFENLLDKTIDEIRKDWNKYDSLIVTYSNYDIKEDVEKILENK